MSEETCWTLIQSAQAGDPASRARFGERYLPVVRAYLDARWRRSAFAQEIEDAVQEVFVECFREQGVLARARAERLESFQRFLLGVARNVALRFEEQRAAARARRGESDSALQGVESDETHLSSIFDRAFAHSVLEEAAALHEREARAAGGRAALGVEVLRLHFDDGLPLRAIAQRLEQDAAIIHHVFADARKRFREALRTVVAFHLPHHPEEVSRECERLVDLLR
jgi:RNA polymerase sigma-70 factor (ECF subfamily)